jgi:AraC-like DNA-binding protein/quercetin dioxygenase-like cupin family protein
MAHRKATISVFRPEGVPGVELQVGKAAVRHVPRHWHEEYQVVAIVGGRGEICYRGTTYQNPAGSMNLTEPGEVHSNQAERVTGCDFLVMNFDVDWFRRAAWEVAPRSETPAFASPTIQNAETLGRFLRLGQVLLNPADPLERETTFLRFLVYLLERQTRVRCDLQPAKGERSAVAVVRDYLVENYAETVNLARLTALTGLSPFHLTRVFSRHIGMPPHAFLKQVRLSRAKSLLRSDVPISRVAAETGFADQSHLTRAFKHVVGVPPGVYQRLGGVLGYPVRCDTSGSASAPLHRG